MDIMELIELAKSQNASDLHMSVNSPPLIRVDGALKILDIPPFNNTDMKTALMTLSTLEKLEYYENELDLDFKYVMPDGTNLRCNAAQERGQISLSIRILPSKVPTIDQLQLPSIFKKLALLDRGLVVISGPTGSGKTTSQAALIAHINANQTRHILTFEDPIEYSHPNIKSKITQRELGGDTHSFAQALKYALRHDPDVIVMGEMRDSETAALVISLAETGHLVITTSHAPYAPQAVERIIDLFPHAERALVQMRLASLLSAVLCQTLVPRADGSGRIAAVEIMLVNSAIRNLIREGRLTLLSNALRDYGSAGSTTLDEALAQLYSDGTITMETVMKFCHDHEEIGRLIQGTLPHHKTQTSRK